MTMIITQTTRLIIRNWQLNDKDVFFQLNNDPAVMHFFPARKSQNETDVLMGEQTKLIEQTGFGFYAVELKESQQIIGLCGLLKTNLEPFIPQDTVEIGWRLLPQFWGFGYISEAAHAIMTHGFDKLKLPEIVSFAVKDNIRSINVMERLGMTHLTHKDFSHPRVSGSHPHLKQHVLYQMQNPYQSI